MRERRMPINRGHGHGEYQFRRDDEWPEEEELQDEEYDDRFGDDESPEDRYERYLEKKYRKSLWER